MLTELPDTPEISMPPQGGPQDSSSTLGAGDVLSYSAGSTQTGPFGFRKLRSRPSLLSAASRWPELLAAYDERPALFINAYPAAIDRFARGITVDTYLSQRVLSRALQLGQAGGHPTFLAGQPLFLADALWHHVEAGRPLPETLTLLVGGYPLPQSLEGALEDLLEPHVRRFFILQGFGAAEVDAGCMMGRERNDSGEVIYYPRPDVKPEVDGDELLLTLCGTDGTPYVERFRTGDLARSEAGGWVIWNPRRLHPEIAAELESWSTADWQRRTGHVRRAAGETFIQLREGETPRQERELELFDFASRFGFSWLDKPDWR